MAISSDQNAYNAHIKNNKYNEIEKTEKIYLNAIPRDRSDGCKAESPNAKLTIQSRRVKPWADKLETHEPN
jgi:hypothetical protein